jgi:Flp pilus assembly protein TadG
MVYMCRGGRPRGSRGTATVEFALVLPILLSLLFGIMEFGFLFKDQLVLQQVAREGCRAASIGKMLSEIQATIQASSTDISYASLSYTAQYRTYASGGWSAWTTLGDAGGTQYSNNAPQGAQIRLSCTYTHPLLTGSLFASLIGHPGATTLPLYAKLVMRRE